MRIVVFILFLCSLSIFSYARHIKGGWIGYEYAGVGSSSGTSKYNITVYLYASCTESGPTSQVVLGVFDASSHVSVLTKTIANTSFYTLSKSSFSPCLTNPPSVCYLIYTYSITIELTDIAAGYILTAQDALRETGIVNISNSANSGITFTCQVPGIINGIDYHTNSSPFFVFKDTAIICHKGRFSLPFSATDADGDSLSYSFGDGLDVKGASGQTSSNPPSSPPYPSLTYLSGYSGSEPLGNGVIINSSTGFISGSAPSIIGNFVIAVYVKEWRNGVLLDSLKKELEIVVADCDLSAAFLKSPNINCDDYNVTFKNESSFTNISSYYWDFGVTNITTDVSTLPSPTYSYPDTGHYFVKLKVANTTGCEDSATSDVYIYPGFTPAFTVQGSCYESPFLFTDSTHAAYGTVNNWLWSFGDNTVNSTLQNPDHSFGSKGTYTITLIVTSSKGCRDSVTKNVIAYDRPLLTLPFRDTLICSIDSLTLPATGTGSFVWTPATNMAYGNTSSPIVFPVDTTTYYVTLTQNGCSATDSVKVNVLDFITVSLPPDTTICLSDSIRLLPESYALHYLWSPANGLSNPNIKNQIVAPSANIAYQVIANLGKCQDKDSIRIKVVPYPKISAWGDTSICYAGSAQLNATTTAYSFAWKPSISLQNATILSPIANPNQTTSYVITVYDTLGCPKPSYDTVVVNVSPRIYALTGNDTMIVANQPLKLYSSGGVKYQWYPSTGLNNISVSDPVATLSSAIDSIVYTVRVFSTDGCYAEDAIKVVVFKTGPDIFVPTGFTPNQDGKNDTIKPILVGMKNLESFKIFNRWGQLIFSTTTEGKGWDGRINGILQPTDVFVYIVSGTTYLDKKILKKGTITLIR